MLKCYNGYFCFCWSISCIVTVAYFLMYPISGDLQYGSHSKKRPDNLVIGRTYDHHIYDLVEVGVENFKPMESFKYDKKLAPLIGSKPMIAFIGEGFENVEELKHFKEVLLDLLRGEVHFSAAFVVCTSIIYELIILIIAWV